MSGGRDGERSDGPQGVGRGGGRIGGGTSAGTGAETGACVGTGTGVSAGVGTGTAVGHVTQGRRGGDFGTVVTVTPNPSLDRTYEIAELARGAVLRADADRVDPGGKGVNVSRALAAAGLGTVAVLPLGGPEGALLARLLESRGIEVAGVPVRESTRVNVSLAEPDGCLTKINALGPEISPEEAVALLEAAAERAAGVGAEAAAAPGTGASWIVCSGSLPRGLAPSWYAGLVARAHRQGVSIALDTSGPALSAALRERPDVVKPNAHELAEAVGRPLATVGDAVKAAEDLRSAGAGAVLASLGATGQLLLDATGTYFGSAATVPVRSDVGAGDASLAGFLGAGGAGPEALASAVAHGLAAVQLPGSEMPCPGDLRPGEVTVTAEPPLDHPLGRPLCRPLPDSANGAM
jgi:1-phosphofructokinase